MARYRHLPVWKTALALAVHLEHAVRRLSRYCKYTLGSELRQTAQRLCRRFRRPEAAPPGQRWLLPLAGVVVPAGKPEPSAMEGEADVGADIDTGPRPIRALPVRQGFRPWCLDAGIRSGMTAAEVPAGGSEPHAGTRSGMTAVSAPASNAGH